MTSTPGKDPAGNGPERALQDLRDSIAALKLPELHKNALSRALEFSAAAFIATGTNLLAGTTAESPESKQIKVLLASVMDMDSPVTRRDNARVAALATEYQRHPGELAVVCADPDTRLWLARRLQVVLKLSPHPDNHGVKEVSADPPADKAGKIVVVAPNSPLLGTDRAQAEFPVG